MTTPIVVRTFPKVAFSPDSDREFLWWFEAKELSDTMKQDIVNSYGHLISRDTKYVLLTLAQLQRLCLVYNNVAPFNKATIKERLAGVSYGVPFVNTAECSICTRGGAISVNLYTSKTMIHYAANVNQGFREVLGGDYMYLHFKRFTKEDSPASFMTKNETSAISYNTANVQSYYPYILLSSVPPQVRQRKGAFKKDDICIIKTDVFKDMTDNRSGLSRDVSEIKPYQFLGRIATRQTLSKSPVSMKNSSYDIIASDRQRYTFTMFFDRGNSRTGVVPDFTAQINANMNSSMTIGESMKSQENINSEKTMPMDIGRKHDLNEKDKKSKDGDKKIKTSAS